MMKRFLLFISLLSVMLPVHATPFATMVASDLIMARSQQKFPEAMLTLQTSISEHGYTVARVQRVDIGLTGMGYKTDKYRIVFVGKPHEIKYLTDKYPQLIPYLPPKVSIFAENEETVVVTSNPYIYAEMIDDEEDKYLFDRWESDIYSVFEDFSEAE